MTQAPHVNRGPPSPQGLSHRESLASVGKTIPLKTLASSADFSASEKAYRRKIYRIELKQRFLKSGVPIRLGHGPVAVRGLLGAGLHSTR